MSTDSGSDHDGWDAWDISDEEIKESLKPTIKDVKRATALVLPSGGVKGTYILGVLQYLYEECNQLQHIKSYYGTSIGSIISGLLIIGYTPLEILVYICIKKIVMYLLASFEITKIFTEKSFLDSKVFTALLTEMIHQKIGYIPTMGELITNFGKKLCICTISRDNPMNPLYVSSESHPSLSMVHALHMSSSIPFVFGYARYNDVDYFDGGVIDQFPILYASKIEDHVFGIDLNRTSKRSNTILIDIFDMISLPMNYISHLLKKEVTQPYIEIESENEYTTKNNLSLIHMFISGYRQGKTLLGVIKNIKKEKKL